MRAKLPIISIIILAFVSIECKSPPPPKKVVPKPPDYETEGWLDDSTFQVKAVGKPNPSAVGFGRRRRQAQREAQRRAERRTASLMAEKAGSGSLESTIKSKFGNLIENGRVVRRSFNIDDHCAVVYRVKQKDLKKQVTALAK